MAVVRLVSIASLLAVAAFLAIAARPLPEPPPAPPTAPGTDPLVDLVRSYLRWGRVEPFVRQAPELCRLPSEAPPRSSASADAVTHGRKLYFLFARDRAAYLAGGLQPEGQTIIKESWHPRDETAAGEGRPRKEESFDGELGKLREQVDAGRRWGLDRRAGLFVMHKSAGDWTYAVTTPDGSRFLERGRIASCAGCHDPVRPDRLFGLPR